jgi:hypothetical protein
MLAVYDSSVSATMWGSIAKIWKGVETVMAVTLALTAFAKATP